MLPLIKKKSTYVKSPIPSFHYILFSLTTPRRAAYFCDSLKKIQNWAKTLPIYATFWSHVSETCLSTMWKKKDCSLHSQNYFPLTLTTQNHVNFCDSQFWEAAKFSTTDTVMNCPGRDIYNTKVNMNGSLERVSYIRLIHLYVLWPHLSVSHSFTRCTICQPVSEFSASNFFVAYLRK